MFKEPKLHTPAAVQIWHSRWTRSHKLVSTFLLFYSSQTFSFPISERIFNRSIQTRIEYRSNWTQYVFTEIHDCTHLLPLFDARTVSRKTSKRFSRSWGPPMASGWNWTLKNGLVLWTRPSLVSSLALTNNWVQLSSIAVGLTAKPWFWVVMKQRPVSGRIQGRLWPRLPYLHTIQTHTQTHTHKQHAQYWNVNTVRPRLSGSLAIRKKIAGYRCAAYVMHTT